MNKSFVDILEKFPYKRFVSDKEITPFHFYEKYLPYSKEVWLKFGYFSSNAIRTLSLSFARFIFKGGKITILTNHFYSKKDAEELLETKKVNFELIEDSIFSSDGIKDLLDGEQQHFYNCLRYLQENDRLRIQPVIKIDGSMAHFKEGVFEDFNGNFIGFNGSCNFTYSGLLVNGESIDLKVAWKDEIDAKEIQDKKTEIDKILFNEDSDYKLLDKHELEIVIAKKGQKKELKELLEYEKELNNNSNDKFEGDKIYNDILSDYYNEMYFTPKFPHPEPREYQLEAYHSWLKNGKKGFFAMATGTGKTITSLNCLLEEYKESGRYRAIILVPTIALSAQWVKELELFNFHNVVQISSKSNWKRKGVLTSLLNESYNDDQYSFCIISTYASFNSSSFQKRIAKFKDKDLMIIADEAHNMGAPESLKTIPHFIKKRIGLSATPERKGDEIGTEEILSYFNSIDKYTYEFSMAEAIKKGYLCNYEYYIHLVYLTEEETANYTNLSYQIAQAYDNNDSEKAEKLILIRRKIITKASNKRSVFNDIILDIKQRFDKVKYMFVYIPEGYVNFSNSDLPDNDNKIHELEVYGSLLNDHNITHQRFIGGMSDEKRKKMLDQFKNGNTPALLAMKCLDEGVDVPRAEIGVFCSSTTNPRQFIQRRGRLLRTHKAKEKAVIYDMFVTTEYPSNDSERKIIENELKRAYEFAKLSLNRNESEKAVYDIMIENKFDINEIIK